MNVRSQTQMNRPNTREEILKARVSKALKQRLQAAAVANEKGVSEAMREALLEWLSRVEKAA